MKADPAAIAPAHAAPHHRSQAITDGLMAGFIGAAMVALWFLLIDTLRGQPFQTPNLLGTALFRGVPEAAASPPVDVGMVIAYTGIHFALFWVFGILVATLVIQYERTPDVGYLLYVVAIIFELCFLVVILGFAEPLLREIPWWSVLLGNLLALAGMAAYFAHEHPDLKKISMLLK
jgi:hypothetical protein